MPGPGITKNGRLVRLPHHDGALFVSLLVNSNSGRRPDPGALTRQLESYGARVAVFPIDQVAEALRAGPDRMVLASGDGSIGAVAAACGTAGVPLAVVPAGTANDFARSLDVPDQLDAAVRLAATGSLAKRVDLGWLGDRPFVNVASLGIGQEAARRAAPLKRGLGAAAYPVGAALAALRSAPSDYRVTGDEHLVFRGPAWQVVVGNSDQFGGGASLGLGDGMDGTLEIAILAARRRSDLLRLGWALRRGTVRGLPNMITSRARTVEIAAPRRLTYNVDGELHDADIGRFRLEPAAFSVVVDRTA